MSLFESDFFISQVFWLVVCLLILFFAFSKVFVPRVNSSIITRDKYTNEIKKAILASEQKIASLEEEFMNLQQKRKRECDTIVNTAIKKSEHILNEQIHIVKTEQEDLINATRFRLREELKDVKKLSVGNIEKITESVYQKLLGEN